MMEIATEAGAPRAGKPTGKYENKTLPKGAASNQGQSKIQLLRRRTEYD
jgi:hypothetical protein